MSEDGWMSVQGVLVVPYHEAKISNTGVYKYFQGNVDVFKNSQVQGEMQNSQVKFLAVEKTGRSELHSRISRFFQPPNSQNGGDVVYLVIPYDQRKENDRDTPNGEHTNYHKFYKQNGKKVFESHGTDVLTPKEMKPSFLDVDDKNHALTDILKGSVGGASRARIVLHSDCRKRIIRRDRTGPSYVILNGEKTPLSSLKGQYKRV